MIYAEASYFGGYHFQHIVAWQEYNRIKSKLAGFTQH